MLRRAEPVDEVVELGKIDRFADVEIGANVQGSADDLHVISGTDHEDLRRRGELLEGFEGLHAIFPGVRRSSRTMAGWNTWASATASSPQSTARTS